MTNQIECERCNHRINYDDSAPKFCSECGQSLTGAGSSFSSDDTVSRSPGTPVVFDDATLPPDQTGPVSKKHVERFDLQSVGPYRLVRKLGQGGMGTVYEAQHTENGRNVALKLLSPEVRGTDEMVQRFRRESQIAASINHPRSTFVYESGEHEGQLFITMELMSGGTLKEVVAAEGPLPVGRAVDYVLDMIDGLIVAHNAGIVHRDLKPSNSFVDNEGRIKVGDFGLAKSFVVDSSLTQTGTFMGTPQYAAPEQIRNANIDERTDIYALGGTLFYLLTGRAPFVGNPAQVISSIASDTPPAVNQFAKAVPRSLVSLIALTLEKDPDRRPYNLNMLRDGLLPFSTRGAVTADLGSRMAAFFIDAFFASMLSQIPNLALSLFMMGVNVAYGWNFNPQIVSMFAVVLFLILYFATSEHLWGRTLGKWLMGLRVVDQDLELPGWLAAFVRAAFIPGLTTTCTTLASIYLMSGTDPTDLFDALAFISSIQAVGLFVYVPLLMLFATARRENGFQGFHGMLSGTRVVRISGDLTSCEISKFAITAPQASQENLTLDQFQIVGKFTEDQEQSHQVLLGHDQELQRPIWIFEFNQKDPITDQRRHLLRSNRLRVINESTSDDQSWYATESVPGLPLIDLFGQVDFGWASFYPMIRDIAHELECSRNSDMLPEDFSIDHVWVDHTGNVRILDHTVTKSRVSKYNAAREEDNRGSSPSRVIEQILMLFMERHSYPVAAIDFQQGLAKRHNDPNVFTWIVEQMNAMAEKIVSWTRIDRIGMLAMTFGFEFGVYNSLMFAIAYAFMLFNFSVTTSTAISLFASMLLTFGFGYFFHGGIAIRLMNMALRTFKGSVAAPQWQCGLRNMVAWLPWSFAFGSLLLILFHQSHEEPTLLQIDVSTSQVAVASIMFSLLPTAIALGGIIFAIYDVRRGIPDRIAGTVMMRR